jgi:hypothetical protein
MEGSTRGRHGTGAPSPLRTNSYRADLWGTDVFRDQDAMAITSRRRSGDASQKRMATRVDYRGIFVSGISVLLLPACLLTYYNLLGVTRSGVAVHATFTVVAQAFGSWRIVIPGLAALCVVIGVVDSLLPVAATGAVTVFVALRLAVLAQLAVWIVAAVERTPTTPAHAPAASLTWVAWVAIGVASIAVLGSLASMAKSTYA